MPNSRAALLVVFLTATLSLPAAAATKKKGGSADAGAAAAGAEAKPGTEAGAPAGAPGAPPASSSPMAELKKSNAQLDKILTKNKPGWSPEADLQRAEVRKVVG